MKEVFIIGSKGIPAKYGGFETFVDRLTEKRQSTEIKYHVACLWDNNEEFEYNGARCFNVKVRDIGSAKAVVYDIKALKRCIKYIKEHNTQNAVIYILACRIGPFLGFYKRKLKNMGIEIWVNPDGHEWKRSKWNNFIRGYWKFSERLMVKHADLLVCDSLEIQRYIKEVYKQYNPQTIYIAYGANIENLTPWNDSQKLVQWYKKYHVKENEYYLIVGRFVPENNYETMIREFIASKSKKDLVIICNVEKNNFYNELLEKTKFNKDSRIKFVGTVYDTELITNIRKNAYGYLHGHEVGGTNPSLVEALASTKLNLLLEVNFNKEVGQEGAVYFSKDTESLSSLINEVDMYDCEKIEMLWKKAKGRVINHYSWSKIINDYEKNFLK